MESISQESDYLAQNSIGNVDEICEFHKALAIYRKTRVSKVIHRPIRMMMSMLFEAAANVQNKGMSIKAKTFWNEYMNVMFPEITSASIYRYGFYEEDLTGVLLLCLRPGMVLYDIGAHFGYFSLLASELVGDQGYVCAFEPTPSTYKILLKNVNGKANITSINKAVYSEKTVVSLNDYGIKYSAFNSIYNARSKGTIDEMKTQNTHSIQTTTVDSYIDETDIVPDFVKIDAESAEYEIIVGMKSTLEHIRPIISIEVGDMDVEGVISSSGLVTYLKESSYQPFEYRAGVLRNHEVEAIYDYGNVLFIPDEMLE